MESKQLTDYPLEVQAELKELLKNLNDKYDEVTIEILGKCADREGYTDEFIEQNKLYAQIVLVQHILDNKSNAALAGNAKHN